MQIRYLLFACSVLVTLLLPAVAKQSQARVNQRSLGSEYLVIRDGSEVYLLSRSAVARAADIVVADLDVRVLPAILGVAKTAVSVIAKPFSLMINAIKKSIRTRKEKKAAKKTAEGPPPKRGFVEDDIWERRDYDGLATTRDVMEIDIAISRALHEELVSAVQRRMVAHEMAVFEARALAWESEELYLD